VGVWTDGHEDETGLYVEGEFFADEGAQDVRARLLAAPEAFGLSTNITYRTAEARSNDQGGNDITRVETLDEITITDAPMNPHLQGMAKAASAYHAGNQSRRRQAARAAALRILTIRGNQ
jgi:phage head maturation protease